MAVSHLVLLLEARDCWGHFMTGVVLELGFCYLGAVTMSVLVFRAPGVVLVPV